MKLNLNHLISINNDWIESQADTAIFFQQKLQKLSTEANNFVGWKKLATHYPSSVLKNIEKLVANWKNKYDTLVIIGIGGSYLGVKAGIEFVRGLFPHDNEMDVIFLGNSMSEAYMHQILTKLANRNFCINVISKSGGTLEPAYAFHKCVDLIKTKFGAAEISKRIIATTDASRGILFNFCQQENISTLIIPDDIGGRYSVLTPVGLFPFALLGMDIDAMLKGAKDLQLELNSEKGLANDAMKYAIVRNCLLKQDYKMELFVAFENQMETFIASLKQLFGESEGKQGTSLWPASVIYSSDLHSLGQAVQEGPRMFFETFIKVKNHSTKISIDSWKSNIDNLNFVANKPLHEINYVIYDATLSAHKNEGKRNIIEIEIEKMDAYNFGQICQFFFNACAYSALILGVNPFDQPGVEVYKANILKLLKK